MSKPKRIMYKILLLCILIASAVFAGYYYHQPKTITYEVAVPVKVDVVKVIQTMKPELDPGVCNLIGAAVDKYSIEYELDPALVVAVMARESSFMALSKSSSSTGLMQINEKAHAKLLKEMGITSASLYHINNNVKVGCIILKECLSTSASTEEALDKYVGHHPTYARDVLSIYAGVILDKKG